MLILSSLRKLRQEDSCIFKASLFNIVSSRQARITYKTMSQNKKGRKGGRKEGREQGRKRGRGKKREKRKERRE